MRADVRGRHKWLLQRRVHARRPARVVARFEKRCVRGGCGVAPVGIEGAPHGGESGARARGQALRHAYCRGRRPLIPRERVATSRAAATVEAMRAASMAAYGWWFCKGWRQIRRAVKDVTSTCTYQVRELANYR